MQRIHRALGAALVALALAGCSGNLQKTIEDALPDDDPEYKSSRSLPPLEVPPDLSSATVQETMQVPQGSGTTYSDYANAQQGRGGRSAGTSAVLPVVDNVQVDRAGDQRWLVVRASAEDVWPRVREFWLDNGFLIKMEDPTIGIMETDWAENRADIPQGFIRSMMGKLSDALYSAATRDKFRVRLERGRTPDTTEVYLSHRGAEEVTQGDDFVWQPRPSDPELEAEMLNRMIVFFGVEEERADRMLAVQKDRPARAQMVRDGKGGSALSIKEEFSRAWRRTGLALDRVGFTVEDRDRSRGLYYVRYVDPVEASEKGDSWLSKLKFWGDDDSAAPQDEFLISLIGEGTTTQVVVLNKEGNRELSPTADRILSLLHEQLK